MTQPVAVEERQMGRTVEGGRKGGVIENGHAEAAAGGGLITPELAAIQHRYEEARAYIALSGGSSDTAQDLADPYPDTEAIDIRLVKPPAPHTVTTPPTTAMSVAARYLAERPEDESGPKLERHTASRSRDDEMQVQHRLADSPLRPCRPRRWWRAIRIPVPHAVPAP
jgi:hypothetical protein